MTPPDNLAIILIIDLTEYRRREIIIYSRVVHVGHLMKTNVEGIGGKSSRKRAELE